MAKVTHKGTFERKLAQLAAKLKEPGVLRVGFLEGATAPNGDNLALRAYRLNYGTSKMPARPFMGNTVARHAHAWPDGVAFQLRATDYNLKLTLERTGEAIKGQVKQEIIDLWTPPLSPVTIKRKGFDKPLIEHGDMLNAVAYEVNMSGDLTLSAPSNQAGAYAAAAKAAKPPPP